MKLPETLLNEMHDLFIDYQRDQSAYRDYFSENRKSVKLLIDTVIEQLVEDACGVKPRNANHARLLINNAFASASVMGFENVLMSLNDVLQGYRILETKDYVEYEDEILGFIRGPLAAFCQAVATTPAVAESISARRLAAAVRNV